MKSKKKRPVDINELAASIVADAVEEDQDEKKEDKPEQPAKNPHAVALGRLGGLKGGPARSKKLSKKKRSEIARKAAKTRWEKTQ